MRALTVRQPWAWAIVHGGKDVENRTRNIAGSYRGPVAIHAASKWADVAVWANEVLTHALSRIGLSKWNASLTFFPVGVIIGVVDLVDVHLSNTYAETWNVAEQRSEQCSPWAMRDHYHLVLANPRPLPRPIPAKGRLGLWRPDDTLTAQILEQLGEVTA